MPLNQKIEWGQNFNFFTLEDFLALIKISWLHWLSILFTKKHEAQSLKNYKQPYTIPPEVWVALHSKNIQQSPFICTGELKKINSKVTFCFYEGLELIGSLFLKKW